MITRPVNGVASEAEAKVLRAFLVDPTAAWATAGEVFGRDLFLTPERRMVAAALQLRCSRGRSVTRQGLADDLRGGGPEALAELAELADQATSLDVKDLPDALRELVDAQAPIGELPPPEALGLPVPRPAAGLLDTDFPPPTFAVDPQLPRGEVTELVGAHGIFKSTAALGACLDVATGRCWGSGVTTKGRAVFITMEDSERTIARRVRAWLDSIPAGRERSDAEADVRANFTYLAREHASALALTSTSKVGTVARGQVVEHLSEVLAGAVLVVLETASRLHDGPEMNEALAVFAQAVERIAIATGAAVCIVRHVSKQVARDGTSDSYSGRGGGSFSDAARSVLVMTRERKQGQEDDDADPLAPVRLTHAKSTHTAPGKPITWRPVATEHGVYLYAMSGQETARVEARKLVEHLRGLGPEGVTATELHKRPPAGLSRGAAKAAAKHLVTTGEAVEAVEDRARNKGVTVYRLAPVERP